MIRTLHRTRGASVLGARHPGELGPFGRRPDEDDLGEQHDGLGDEEQLLDDDQDEQHDQADDHRASVRRTDGSATPTEGAATAGFNVTPANTTTEGAAP